MSNLSVKKLNEYKKAGCYTNKKISQLTNTPIATIDRLFSGANKNPTVTLLQKIANLFECTIDDFIEYDKDSPLANYYKNKEIEKMARIIQANRMYKILIDTAECLNPKQLKVVIDVANVIKEAVNE
ncbi:MAG: helix-turn-helix transcriptional regulator [bacterium]|nr:helix-turn-helix transcriptional regulator [bacterium]